MLAQKNFNIKLTIFIKIPRRKIVINIFNMAAFITSFIYKNFKENIV